MFCYDNKIYTKYPDEYGLLCECLEWDLEAWLHLLLGQIQLLVQLTVDLGNQNAKDANCGLDTAATLHLNHDQRER